MDTEITQVAIFLTCVAYYRVLIEGSDILPDSYAGHSVGEYAALVCFGTMRFEDGLSLIRRRGQLMQKVSDDMGDGGMLAIVGMAYPEVEELTEACVKDGTEVFIEAGRGKVLSNLLKKNKGGDYEVYPLGDMKMCELFKERVSRGIDFGRLANKKSSKFYTG